MSDQADKASNDSVAKPEEISAEDFISDILANLVTQAWTTQSRVVQRAVDAGNLLDSSDEMRWNGHIFEDGAINVYNLCKGMSVPLKAAYIQLQTLADAILAAAYVHAAKLGVPMGICELQCSDTCIAHFKLAHLPVRPPQKVKGKKPVPRVEEAQEPLE